MINNPAQPRRSGRCGKCHYDGTDAVMLSAESAAGKYPVQSIRMMSSIILESERHSADLGHHSITSTRHLNR